MALFRFAKRDIKKLEKERDVEGIIALLKSDDNEVVFSAIEALTRIGDPRGIEAMMQLVDDTGCSEVIRAKAWLALDVGIERESKKRTDWK